MVLTLYKIDASPPVRAVYMTIEALNLPDVEYIDVNLLEGEHLKEQFVQMNPQHTVPTLKDDDFVIWDSHAICGYLVTQYGDNDALYPNDPKKRALVDQKLHFDSGILFPSLRGTVEPVFFWGEKQLRTENLEKIEKGYKFAESFLTTPWLAGDHVTLADICCVATISSMHEVLPIDENKYPKLSAWLARCSKENFYKKGNEGGLLQFRQLLKSKLS
ncbi:glutathione S-transferase 1 [Amyelois transitella]|uniref:glutathione S-transferase 1 n=1 Tax=Amyelois transitella TaxID=680683 RepID=UPI0029900574|nr:glutathione S-transferase 1 [Amyelois transitella]